MLNKAIDNLPHVFSGYRMNQDSRPIFSICIPAYNRARHLPQLLDSIFTQEFNSFEVVICEDRSPERTQIAEIVRDYQNRFAARISYYENDENLGYDANLRALIEKAKGRFCWFMGNDDLVCPGAFDHVRDILQRHDDVGVVLKGYAWFDQTPDRINQEIRYVSKETSLSRGAESIRVCFRRCGVISGFIIDREAALSAATERFDGTLYYQMYLAATVLCEKCAVVTPHILVLCRNSELPDFGNSKREKGLYVPGCYTPAARLNMIGGALSIIRNLRDTKSIDVVDQITRDYANYFYLCIRDQLKLPITQYWRMYRTFGKMGFQKYPMFHIYCAGAYLLGQAQCDWIIRSLRNLMGRSPQWGFAKRH